MALYHLEFVPSAARALAKLEPQLQRRIARRLDVLVFDPRPRNTEKLRGTANRYRTRVGDYRIVYDVEDDVLLVLILRVGHRREIYRQR